MEEWIEEFLFRGRPPSGPGSEIAPAFHLVIGRQAQSPLDPTKKVQQFVGPLNVAQADLAGWPLDRIVAGINAEALKRISVQDAEIQTLAGEKSALEQQIAAQTAAVAELQAVVDQYEAAPA